MLYPKVSTKKEKKGCFTEKIQYIKDCGFQLLKSFRSYNSFRLFLTQKFHF